MPAKLCRLPNCTNNSEYHRTLCSMHRARYQKKKSFSHFNDIAIPPEFAFNCKIHGFLTLKEITFRQCNGANAPKTKYCKQCLSINQIRRNKLNPDRVKLYNKKAKLKKLFGLSYDEYLSMKETQKNLCLICKMPESDIDKRTMLPRELAVDHCHTTGKVRGLLCKTCNLGLGYFNDNPKFLEIALNYLRLHK